MPYQGYPDGVYLAAQPSRKGVFVHYLVLDIGNRLEIPGADGLNPVVVHQSPPHIRADWFSDTGGCQLVAIAGDDAAARIRYQAALTNPDYYVLRHNCEHFARFVVAGTWESKQLQVVGWLVGITALVIVAANSEAPPQRRAQVEPSMRGDWRYATRRRRRGAERNRTHARIVGRR